MKLMQWVMANASDIPFIEEKILYLDTTIDDPFVVEERYIDNTFVPVSQIIGTCHSSYAGLTWHEFLEHGQRIGSALELADENPDYYFEDQKKIHLGFKKLPSGYFIEEGNHRSVIAKILLYRDGKYDQSIKGVYVMEHIFDFESAKVVEKLQNEILAAGLDEKYYVEASRCKINGEVSEPSTVRYRTWLSVVNKDTGKQAVIDDLASDISKQRVQLLIEAIVYRRWWSKWFSKNEFSKFVG